MLTYKKAKELKDAGLKWDEIENFTLSRYETYPTLSKLIEACGDDFHCLIYTTKGGLDSNIRFWSAGKDNLVVNWSNGSTPEEAVANLWLALNKK